MEKSLYERLGGAQGISALVDDIVAAHLKNPVIKARFEPYNDTPDRMAEVKKHLCDFLAAGSGGPEQYSGRTMPDAHRGMNISAGEYLAATDDIMRSLEKHNIDEQTRKDILAITFALKDEIIQV